MEYLTNAFSLNMLNFEAGKVCVEVDPITPAEVPKSAASYLSHPDTARLVSSILGRECPENRQDIRLSQGDILFVAQYPGPRLLPGATTLPEGAKLEFLRVKIIPV